MTRLLEGLRRQLPPDARSRRPALPQSLSGYRLRRLMGRGGFSRVYEATVLCADNSQKPPSAASTVTTYHDPVAIKLMKKEVVLGSQMLPRVLNEISLLWTVPSHPHVVELLEYFEDDDHVYLVMELCRRGELYRFLQQRRLPAPSAGQPATNPVAATQKRTQLGTLSEDESRYVLRQVVAGLAHLHRHGILHRDLKLSNLLLTDSLDIKIGDFGLAQLESQEDSALCGTPNYISPELLIKQPCGTSSDVWALGCLMYTMLVGRPPFEESRVRDTLDRVARADFHLPPWLTVEASSLIQDLLQKDPDRRIKMDRIHQHPFFQGKASRLIDMTSYHPAEPMNPAHPNHGSILPVPSAGPLTAGDQPVPPIVLVPLDTRHLNPIRQSTKHAVVEISRDGEVWLDFAGDPNRMVISRDGNEIYIYKNLFMENWRQRLPDAQYSMQNLPSKLVKKYKYATRFVDVVKSKTPKILLQTPQAKCLYMLNDGYADFEASFPKQGIRLLWFPEKGSAEVKRPSEANPVHKAEGWPACKKRGDDVIGHGDKVGQLLPTSFQPLWQHLLASYRQCLDADRETCWERQVTFPMVLKFAVSLNSDAMLTSPPESIPDRNGVSSAGQSRTVLIPVPDTASVVSIQDRLRNIPTPFTVQSGSPNRTSSRGSRRPLQMHHMASVGWCLQLSRDQKQGTENDGMTEFMLLFQDGCRLVIETPSSEPSAGSVYPVSGSSSSSSQGSGQSQSNLASAYRSKSLSTSQCFVRYSAASDLTREERFPIDKRLPAYIKQKLVYFPKFVRLFQQQEGEGVRHA